MITTVFTYGVTWEHDLVTLLYSPMNHDNS